MNTHQESPKPSKRAARIWASISTVVLIALAALLVDRLIQVQTRLDQLEAVRLDEARAIHWNLDGVQRELETVRVDLDETDSLSTRLQTAETQLGAIGGAIEAHASSLSELESEREVFGPQVLEKQFAQRDQKLQQDYDSLKGLITNTHATAEEARNVIHRLESEIASERDLTVMWRELLGPVVQIAGDTSVGSGVLLKSTFDQAGGNYRTYLMTAWHVIRDIQGDLSHTDMPVPVFIYAEDGTIEQNEASLLAFDADIDAALLELRTELPFPNGADLASRAQLGSTRIFDEIYAIGCPLGNDPIPTRGEVSTLTHRVDGESYWMINAPTYIGNSGGGIFASETHELLGIFSKIYTHGTLRPTIVPHMGLVTPLTAIYDWLETEGYGALIPSDNSNARVASLQIEDETTAVDSSLER